MALQQSHLPKMREMDLVELGHDGVKLTDTASDLDIYLEIVPKDDINWSQYYIGLSALSTLLVIGSWAGMYPFNVLPKIGWAGVIVVFFLVSAVVHTFHSRRMRVA